MALPFQRIMSSACAALSLLLTVPAITYGQSDSELVTIFPRPQSVTYTDETFTIEESVPVLVPESASIHDLFVARSLVAELSDRYGRVLTIRQADRLPDGEQYILLGDAHNPLVRQFYQESGLSTPEEAARPEGYHLLVTSAHIVVAGKDSAGTFYGLQSVRQLLKEQDGVLTVPGVKIADAPRLPIRGLRLYVPGPEHISFFKRFIRDFAALYKFNTVILEVNAVMRLDRHPELNVGAMEFARDLLYTRRDRPDGPGGQFQDSAHHDAGDGQILEKEDFADLVAYLRRYHFEVIPEIPTLTHVYYLLSRHRELAEIQTAEWPDTYCPLQPGTYDLVFDVFDEYIDVIQPRIVHIGHDEWRMPIDVCERCRGRDYRELFIQDVNRLYDYLRAKNIRVAMWGDHLLENVRGIRFRERKTDSGYTYHIPGGLTREQVRIHIPKDILVFNWFWSDRQNDLALEELGFQQVYGNLTPAITQFSERSASPSVLGGAASSWAATTPFNFGKDLLYEFLGCAYMLWSAKSLDQAALEYQVQTRIPSIRRSFRGYNYPSEDSEPASPIDLGAVANLSSINAPPNLDLGALLLCPPKGSGVPFTLLDPAQTGGNLGIQVVTNPVGESEDLPAAIPIGTDVSSLVFLHASGKAGSNDMAYRSIFNFDDSAELLGWYEVLYQDGYRISIPLRYGVNIAAWDPASAGICYQADPVRFGCSDGEPQMFYAFEWRNPRFGKVITSVSLRGVSDFHDWRGNRTSPNRIILLALTAIDRRRE